ncbi:MAG: HAD family hydrolase [Pseudomonadota bacterium]
MDQTMIVAAWSGPRNLSTAMMYSFANRPDFDAIDEPFYAAHLARTGRDHPLREAVLASQPTDPATVAERCAKDGNPHVYQKHMAHHMHPGFPMDWVDGATHIHLIRHPARVIASYGAKWRDITEADIGFAAQATLYDKLGGVVLDTSDLRQAPEIMLKSLCAEIGLPWSDTMLEWPAGPKPYDGVWAGHWYNSVHASTGFAGPEGPLPATARQDLLEAALPFYEALKSRALPSAHSAS